MAKPEEGELNAVPASGRGHSLGDMRLDRGIADAELMRNLLVLKPLGNESDAP